MKKMIPLFVMFSSFSLRAELQEINVASGTYTLTAADVASGSIQKTGAGELVIDSTISGLTDAIQIDAGTVRITGSGTSVTQNKYTGSYRNPCWPWKDGTLVVENGATLMVGNELLDSAGVNNDVQYRKIFVKNGATLQFTVNDGYLSSHENGGRAGNSFVNGRQQAYLEVNAGNLVLPANNFTVGNRMQSLATRYAQLVLTNGSTMTGRKLVVGNRACGLGDYLVVDSSTVTLTDGIYLDPANKDWSHAGILFKDSAITLAKLQSNRPAAQADRSVKFDGATFVPMAASAAFFSLDSTTACNHLLAGGLTVNTAYDVTLDALFDGVGGITKQGAGQLTLMYDNTYTGLTRVEAGTLVINGTQAAAPLTIEADATCAFASAPSITTLTLASGATLSVTGFGTTVGSASGYSDATLVVNSGEWPLATPIVTSSDDDFLVWVAEQLTAAVSLSAGLEFAIKDGAVQVAEAGAVQKVAVWTGAGADANWSTGDNWNGGERVHSGDNLVFDGTTRPENVNDLGDVSVLDVLFPVTAGAFRLSGSGTLLVVNALTNLSENVQTLALPVELPQTEFALHTVGNVAFSGGLTAVQEGTRLVKTGVGKLTVATPDTKTMLDLREGSVSVTGITAPRQAFSSATGAVKVNGVLDAGGAAVVIADGGADAIATGSVLTNGTFTYSRPNEQTANRYLPWDEGTVTLSEADFTAPKLFSGGGNRINRATARGLVIDNRSKVVITESPAYIVSRDNGDGLNDNGQEDNTTPVTVKVLDGSTLTLPQDTYIGMWSAFAAARSGRLIVDNGSVVRGTNLNMGFRAGKGWLYVTNSVLDFTTIGLCPNQYGGTYGSNGDWAYFTRSTVTNQSLIVKASSYSANSPQYVSFDDARFVARADSAEFICKAENAPNGRLEILSGGLTIDSNGHDIGISARTDLFGAGGLVKTGAGTLTLASTNAYEGVTVVEAGTLKLTGVVSGDIDVRADATLELDAASSAPAVVQASSLAFAPGAKIRVAVPDTRADEYPILLLKTGATVTGTPAISVTGTSRRGLRFRTRVTADGLLCTLVPPGLAVIFK